MNNDYEVLKKELIEAKLKIAKLEQEIEKKNGIQEFPSKSDKSDVEIEWGLLYNAISQPIAILDTNQKVISINKALQEKLGVKSEDVANLQCWQLFHESGAKYAPEGCPFKMMQSCGTDQSYEMVVEAFNGTFLVNCTPIYNKSGKIDRVIHIATDISERKENEEQIKKSEQHLRLLTDNIVDTIWQLSSDFVFTYATGGTETMIGYKPSELIGKSLFQIMEPSSRAIFLEELSRIEQIPAAERSNERMRYELQFLKKNGGTIWCEILPSYILDDSGKLIGFQGVTRDITDRKQIEQINQNSQQKLAGLIDFLPDPTFAIDSKGKIIVWNKAIETLTSLKKEEMIGKDNFEYAFAFYGKRRPMLIDLVSEDNKEISDLYDHIERKNGDVYGEVYDAKFRNGKGAHLWGIASPLKDSIGNITGAIESIRDISEIRRTELELKQRKEQLHEANAMLNLIIDSAPVNIFWKDLNLVFRGCNTRFAKNNGYDSPQSIIGLTDYDLCPKETADEYREIDFEIIRTGVPQLNIVEPPSRAVSKGDWIKTSRVPLRDSSGAIIGVLVVFEDITEIQNAYQSLNEASERLRLVFDVTNDGVWDWDIETGETHFSDRYYSMLGYDKLEFEQNYLSWEKLLHPDDKKRTLEVIVEHLKNPEQLFDVEFRLKTKSGEYKWINGRGKVVELNQDGKPKRMIGSHVDLSERKKAEEKILVLNQQLVSLNSDLEIRVAKRTYELQNALKNLEDSNEELISMNEHASIDSENIMKLNEELIASEIELKKVLAAKDKFFSVIAHELKTPFSGFLLLSDMMAKDFDEISVKDMKNIAITINNSATSLYNLLESLLQWSRFQLGKVPIKYENVDLHEIASNIVYLFNNHAKDKEIEVSNLIPKNTLVYCDRNTITSVFRNLVSNSLKFTNKDGFVEIGLYPANENNSDPTFYVKDSGIGIPEKDLQKIFDVDTHFSTKGTNNEAGSGLGLTLCKEFIDKHKGSISIDSKVGKGTIVSFTLHVNEKN